MTRKPDQPTERQLEHYRSHLHELATTVPKSFIEWDYQKTIHFKQHCRNAIKFLNQELHPIDKLTQHIKILSFYHQKK